MEENEGISMNEFDGNNQDTSIFNSGDTIDDDVQEQVQEERGYKDTTLYDDEEKEVYTISSKEKMRKRGLHEKHFVERYINGYGKNNNTRYLIGNKILRGPGLQWITPVCLVIFCIFVDWLAKRLAFCESVDHIKKWIDLVCWMVSIVLIWTAFTNPGHLMRKMTFTEYTQFAEHRQIECYSCLTLKSDDAAHCDDCGVCIVGLDHHCIVMGNCIGKYNIVPFYVMLFASVGGLMSVYVITIYSMQKCYSKNE